jgi:positive regulator of sigma E activity
LISQIVEVVDTSSGYMIIKPVEQGCHSCSSEGCGVSNLSRLFGKRDYSLRVSNTDNFRTGDTAELLLNESVFLRSVSLQYLLPLICMILFVMLASWLTLELWLQSITAVLGLGAGVLVSRHLIKLSESRIDNEHMQVRRIS